MLLEEWKDVAFERAGRHLVRMYVQITVIVTVFILALAHVCFYMTLLHRYLNNARQLSILYYLVIRKLLRLKAFLLLIFHLKFLVLF